MEPRIQYTTTSDGVNIAYWTLGEGPPLVYMSEAPLSHIHLEWQIPQARRWYEGLAEKGMVVRYDPRGAGLSDRDVTDFSFAAEARDLEAVVDRLELKRFALFAVASAGPAAITYAAAQRGRMSHLILWCVRTHWAEFAEAKHVRALDALLEVDWEAAAETWARMLSGGSDERAAQQGALLLRESSSAEALRARFESLREFDVRPLLPQLKPPTLVLQRRQIPNRDNVRIAKDLAASIPDSRLVLLEGSSGAPFLDDWSAGRHRRLPKRGR